MLPRNHPASECCAACESTASCTACSRARAFRTVWRAQVFKLPHPTRGQKFLHPTRVLIPPNATRAFKTTTCHTGLKNNHCTPLSQSHAYTVSEPASNQPIRSDASTPNHTLGTARGGVHTRSCKQHQSSTGPSHPRSHLPHAPTLGGLMPMSSYSSGCVSGSSTACDGRASSQQL